MSEQKQPMIFSRDGSFLRNPASHRAQAALLRKAGNHRLAFHCDQIARAIEQRQQQKEPALAAMVKRIMDEALASAKRSSGG
jgi:hypothetical protein